MPLPLGQNQNILLDTGAKTGKMTLGKLSDGEIYMSADWVSLFTTCYFAVSGQHTSANVSTLGVHRTA